MGITTHTEHAALLAAVIEQRHDLTPRLVLADFLDEYAEAIAGGSDHCGRVEDVRARAEFVRFQWSLAKLWPELGTLPLGESAPTHLKGAWQMIDRLESLLARHRHAWLDDEFHRAGIKGDFYGGMTYADDEMRFSVPFGAAMRGGQIHKLRWKWRGGFLDCLSCSWALWNAIGDRVYRGWPVTEVEIQGKPPGIHWKQQPQGEHWLARIGNRPVRHAVPLTGSSRSDGTARFELLAAYWPGVAFTFQS